MTPEHIDAVLPRVPAGIPALGGDLTDPDERTEAIDWLMSFYGAAEARTPSVTPAALRSEHRAESGQHTLTAQTTIEMMMPCGPPPGLEHGWHSGAIAATFAVCVVDGERCRTHWDDGDERCCVCGHRYPDDHMTTDKDTHPPAWLIEARDGTCPIDHMRHAQQCSCLDDSASCCAGPCIDGRPAVEVRLWVSGDSAWEYHTGTVEQGVLPVQDGEAFDLIDAGDQDTPLPVVTFDPHENCLLITGYEVDGYRAIPLDITVAPGQYVVLVRMEDA